ncbi:putative nucleoside diphosphate kinase 1-like, partial [Capsicum annuum]
NLDELQFGDLMLGSIHRKLNFWDKNGEVSGMDQTQSAISESGETPGNQSHEQNQEHQQNGDAEDETPPLKKIRRAPISEANSFLMKHVHILLLHEVVAGSAAWLGRGLSCVCAQRRESDARPSFDLTPSQEECLLRLQNRIDVAYDSSIPEHRFLFVFDLKEALKALWKVAFPEEKLYGLISEQWKEMGWQGKDPSTDFRYISISLSQN